MFVRKIDKQKFMLRLLYFSNKCASIEYARGPRYMQEIGSPKIGSHITNLHLKRPKITVN